MEAEFDPYKIVGVSETATQAQIKRAYKKRAKEAHPDKGGSAEAMAELNEAYAILTDVGKREAWDRTKSRGSAARTAEGQAIAEVQVELTRLLIEAMSRTHESKLKRTDLRRLMLDSLAKQLQGIIDTRKDEEKKLAMFKEVRERWETSGDFNYAVAAIDSQMTLVQNAINACDRAKDLNTRVTACVITHRYRFDEFKSPEDLYGFVNGPSPLLPKSY